MGKFKNFCKKIQPPNVLFSVIYSFLSILVIALTIVLLCLGYNGGLMYALYALSAIMLCYFVFIIVFYFPKIREAVVRLLKKYKFTNELLESYGYRSVIFASCSFLINIAYAIFQAVFAILSHSIWYGALSVYYIVLSSIRGGIIAISRKRKNNEFPLYNQVKSYRNCGIYLVVLNFALAGGVVQMVVSNGGYKYAGIMIYVMAMYAFYKLGMGIYNLIKARRHNDYTVQSIKNINFADALVSILALQTAMFQAFDPELNTDLANSITGGAVLTIIIIVGLIMIISGNKKLKQLKMEKTNDQISI